MADIPPSRKWLILEQEDERSKWCSMTPNAWKGIFADEFGPVELDPANLKLQDNQVIVLFIPRSGGHIPEAIRNEVQKGMMVWCHYGGDIRPSQIRDRWAKWERLLERERGGPLLKDAEPPMPFSSKQLFAWSREFLEIRKAFADTHVAGQKWAKGASQRVNTLLEQAWIKAQRAINLEARISAAAERLPAVLAARHLLRAFPREETPIDHSIEILKALSEHCQKIGIRKTLRSLQGTDNDAVRTFASTLAARMDARAKPSKDSAKAIIGNWRTTLEDFLRFAIDDSKRVLQLQTEIPPPIVTN